MSLSSTRGSSDEFVDTFLRPLCMCGHSDLLSRPGQAARSAAAPYMEVRFGLAKGERKGRLGVPKLLRHAQSSRASVQDLIGLLPPNELRTQMMPSQNANHTLAAAPVSRHARVCQRPRLDHLSGLVCVIIIFKSPAKVPHTENHSMFFCFLLVCLGTSGCGGKGRQKGSQSCKEKQQ